MHSTSQAEPLQPLDDSFVGFVSKNMMSDLQRPQQAHNDSQHPDLAQTVTACPSESLCNGS